MKKILITGATSGIGRGLAYQFAKKGHVVGAVGRRTDKLESLKADLGDQCYIKTLDVTDLNKAKEVYAELAEEMGGLDIMILNAGFGREKMFGKWEIDETTISVNVMAFAHGCHWAFDYFNKQGHGQIVGVSSIASHLAAGAAAAYTASKHFISNYMTGFKQKARRVDADISITDIRPGFVESEMTAQNKKMFWVATTEKACKQIVSAIEKKKKVAYITRRWWLISLIARLTPRWAWDRF